MISTLVWGGGFSEKSGSQMLKLKHSRGNMGLNLTCSFQELATRTETSEQAGVVESASQRQGSGGREHTNAPFVDGELLVEAFPAISPCASHVYVCL